jgi:integrase/recombinase XerC
MFDKFIAYLKFEKRYSEHTLKAYERDLNDFLVYADIKAINEFSTLSASYIRSWIVYLIENGLKNRSVNRKLASLRSFYKWLVKEQMIESSPMGKVNGPKSEKHLPQFVKESELKLEKIEALFEDDFEGKRDALMFELFLPNRN